MTSSDEIILDQFLLGPMDNFLYFIGCAQTRQVAVVDPAWDTNAILKRAEDKQLRITAAILTHGHPDHINALDPLVAACDIPVYISEHEAPIYMPAIKNLKKVAPHDKIPIGKVTVECIHTPGHTPGGQCLKIGKNLITGDTLFINGCGRCDLPGGDAKTLYHSLYEVILKLPEDTVIYPGHDYGPVPSTTLKEQKKTNPYLQSQNIQEFLHERMGI